MTWLRFVYFVVTVLVCGQVMLQASFATGAGALAGTALSYFSVATFVGSFRARVEQNYSQKDLTVIGAIALVLRVAGFALIFWSGFRIIFSQVVVPGFIWAIIGVVVAIVTTTKKDAL